MLLTERNIKIKKTSIIWKEFTMAQEFYIIYTEKKSIITLKIYQKYS